MLEHGDEEIAERFVVIPLECVVLAVLPALVLLWLAVLWATLEAATV